MIRLKSDGYEEEIERAVCIRTLYQSSLFILRPTALKRLYTLKLEWILIDMIYSGLVWVFKT